MRRLGWIASGAAVLLGLAFAMRDGSGRIGAEPEASGPRAPRSKVGGRIGGAVIHVRDGDPVELGRVAVRIANLDCAEQDTERDMVEGQAASVRMRELVAGQEVVCELEGRRSYDREVGTCALVSSGEDLGEALIAEGAYGRWESD